VQHSAKGMLTLVYSGQRSAFVVMSTVLMVKQPTVATPCVVGMTLLNVVVAGQTVSTQTELWKEDCAETTKLLSITTAKMTSAIMLVLSAGLVVLAKMPSLIPLTETISTTLHGALTLYPMTVTTGLLS